MIFVTVGTEKFQFDRLLKIVEGAVLTDRIPGDVIIQRGKSKRLATPFQQEEYYPFEKIVNFMSAADIIISHAGIGTTLLSLKLGKIPILFPRRQRYSEHLDDHQLDFTQRIEATGKVLVAYNESQLLNCLNNYQSLVEQLNPSFENKDRSQLIKALTQCVEEFNVETDTAHHREKSIIDH